MKQRISILTGAGISAESGISTFRDSNGLWENHDVQEVATPEGWAANPELVMRFYNERRKQLYKCEPNLGHKALVELEKYYDVQIITQNVDDLHERAGSSNVLHLHGELKKSRSQVDESLIYDIDGWELKFGDTCEKGSQLRPYIVWFGEDVPEIENAIDIIEKSDFLIVIGTSLNVYPASGLVNYISATTPLFLVDPKEVDGYISHKYEFIKANATEGVPLLVDKLIELIK